MKQETLEKAVKLKNELDRTIEILEAMNKEKSHWWSFVTPDTISRNDDCGFFLTDRLRKKFKDSVEKSIVELENLIEAL